MCFVTDCSLYFQVFLSKLRLIYNEGDNLLYHEGKGFQRKQTVNDFRRWVQYQKATNSYNSISTFVSPFYTFSSAGNIIVYMPI